MAEHTVTAVIHIASKPNKPLFKEILYCPWLEPHFSFIKFT